MPETRQFVERKLAISRKQLTILEEKIALYTELEAPVHLVTQRNMEREEIARLEALLESAELPEGDEGTISEQEKSGDAIRATISGDISGQVAVGGERTLQIGPISGQVVTVGTGITQIVGAGPPKVTEADLAELQQALADLKAKVAAEAPPDKKDAALERLEELGEAVTAEEPDLSTMEYVKGWFVKNQPGLAGAVTSVVVHPTVGKLVQAAGDALAAEFRRRFSGE
jgi:hypothetical protein